MEYTTNIIRYTLRFSAEATVEAENEAQAVEELRNRDVGDCDDLIISHVNAS